ncbi:hypothetical protein D7Z54_11330 [Salibacterium salarium]|uniref:NodB homology domain-containing protein n=1 Tax=Salibacterium salarium TaxID=284579 RepID=A0A3R9QTQ1_9BACI|nr:polysaccharide deacetylase family protein [Salibacterium salarium]RSL33212.1 hypothetical protein D7Z54_11330 [Salibacterium salarium]
MRKQIFSISIFVLIFILMVQAGTPLHSFADIHNTEPAAAHLSSPSASLYEKLEEASETYNEPPRDAVVDNVWKAIPGYNGKMVNVKESYEAMKGNDTFKQEDLVMDEIPPNIHLSDLPPSPIYKGNPAKPMVSFLINVSWGEDYIPSILKTLREENVKVTFFLEGKWVQKQPKLAKMIKEEGHEIGSHAYSHPNLAESSRAEIRQELQQTNETLEAVLSEEPSLLAPPSGSFNDDVVEIASDFNMYTILWTADTVDWKDPDPWEMAEKTASKVENGSMVLMHPTSSTARGLKEMIRLIKNKDLQLNTVTKLLDETRINQRQP